MAKSKLSPRQTAFIHEYLIDKNATEAAKRAGYSEKTCYVQGPRQLENVRIKAAIDEALKEQTKRTQVSGDLVIKRIDQMADFDPALAYNEKGHLKPIHEIPEAIRKCIKTIRIFEEFDGVGRDRVKIGETVEVQWIDRLKANELLGRHFKLFTDRLEVSGTGALAERLAKAKARMKK